MKTDDDTTPKNDETPADDQPASTDASDTSADTTASDSANDQDAPADALSRTPEDLEEEQAEQAVMNTDANTPLAEPPEKKVSPIKKFFRKVNLYLLIFILLLAITAIIATVNYLNSQKEPVEASIASQQLTQDALKQLANTNASVGSASQTLTIQGNAVIDGQTLMRGNLNVAGNLQTAGEITGPSLTISGATNLGDTQINSLQVASNTAIQGNTTMRDLSVSGASTFDGPMTASQITVTNLILSGNATLQVPNHISFTGPAPSRTINAGVLGAGGSASVSGSDTTGTININTGNNPAAGCFARINFRQAFSNEPNVIVSPVGFAAGKTQYYVSRDTGGFSICTSAPAPANAAFAFDYFVTN